MSGTIVRMLYRYTRDMGFDEDVRRLFMSVGLVETMRMGDLAAFEAFLVNEQQRSDCLMAIDSVKTITEMVSGEECVMHYRERPNESAKRGEQ